MQENISLLKQLKMLLAADQRAEQLNQCQTEQEVCLTFPILLHKEDGWFPCLHPF